LFTDYDLRTDGVLHIVTPKGTPVYLGGSLGTIARHISEHPSPEQADSAGTDPSRRPDPRPRPWLPHRDRDRCQPVSRLTPPHPMPDPTPPATPASIAATMAAILAGHGITRTYTAACDRYAVISITTHLTAWTNGRLLWITHDGQRETWPATDTRTAAARLATLARHPAP